MYVYTQKESLDTNEKKELYGEIACIFTVPHREDNDLNYNGSWWEAWGSIQEKATEYGRCFWLCLLIHEF